MIWYQSRLDYHESQGRTPASDRQVSSAVERSVIRYSFDLNKDFLGDWKLRLYLDSELKYESRYS